MILVTTSWKGNRSFKMIPTSLDCPYNEVIFDGGQKVLAIVSKEHKNNFHMMPVIDAYGVVKTDVPKNLKDQGKAYREERVVLDTYYEYFIEDKEEIISFIEAMADNADTYDFRTLVEASFAKVELVEEEVL